MSKGRLQQHWESVPLGSVCAPTKLTNPNKQPDQPFTYIDVSSVSNESFRIVAPKQLLGADAPSRARQLVQSYDLLFATVRPALRRIAMVPTEYDGQVCSTGFCVVRPDRMRLDPLFAFFFLLTEGVAKQVENMQKGATYPAINDSDLFDLAVPLPPLAEQQAIAQALRAVQAALESRRRALVLERECKIALMSHLFTHGTMADQRLAQTPYGAIPERWRVILLRECAHVQTGVAKGRDLGNDAIVTLPYLRVANVQNGFLDLSEIKEITLRCSEVDRYRLQPDDVVLTEGG